MSLLSFFYFVPLVVCHRQSLDEVGPLDAFAYPKPSAKEQKKNSVKLGKKKELLTDGGYGARPVRRRHSRKAKIRKQKQNLKKKNQQQKSQQSKEKKNRKSRANMAAAFRGTAYRFGVFTEFFSPPSSIYSLSLSLLFFSPFLLIDSERLFFFLLSSYRIFSEFAFTEWSTPPTGCRYTVGLVSLGFFFHRVFQPIIRASGQREREREMSKRWVSAVFAPDSTPAPSRSTTNKTQTQKKKKPGRIFGSESEQQQQQKDTTQKVAPGPP